MRAPPSGRTPVHHCLLIPFTSQLQVLMILSLFHHLKRYRLYFLVVTVASCMVHAWMMTMIPLELVPGAFVPDAAWRGYTPQQALRWYELIGPKARNLYFQMVLVDLLFIIPSYVLLLGSQLVVSDSPKLLCYFPVITALFDLIETLTHVCAVWWYGVWSPSVRQLVVASAATQFKYAFLIVSVLLVLVFWKRQGTVIKDKNK